MDNVLKCKNVHHPQMGVKLACTGKMAKIFSKKTQNSVIDAPRNKDFLLLFCLIIVIKKSIKNPNHIINRV